jgi:hypothetical protein
VRRRKDGWLLLPVLKSSSPVVDAPARPDGPHCRAAAATQKVQPTHQSNQIPPCEGAVTGHVASAESPPLPLLRPAVPRAARGDSATASSANVCPPPLARDRQVGGGLFGSLLIGQAPFVPPPPPSAPYAARPGVAAAAAAAAVNRDVRAAGEIRSQLCNRCRRPCSKPTPAGRRDDDGVGVGSLLLLLLLLLAAIAAAAFWGAMSFFLARRNFLLALGSFSSDTDPCRQTGRLCTPPPPLVPLLACWRRRRRWSRSGRASRPPFVYLK